MKSKERFISTLLLKPADKIPLFEFLDSQNLFEHLTGKRPKTYDIKLAVECSFKLGFDAVWAPFGGIAAFTDETNAEDETYVDEWGVTYKRTSYSWPCDGPIAFPIKSIEDLKILKIPDPTKPERLNDINTAIKLTNNKLAVIGGICGPFTIVYLGMGYEKLSFAIYDDPELIIQFQEAATDFLVKASEKMIGAGVDTICIGEDLGFNAGPFLSMPQMKKFVFPYLKKLIGEIKKRDIPVILHSDGNLNLILEDIINLEINALHPIEFKANMDLGKIKDKFGNKICLIGGIKNDVICYGSPEDARNEVNRVISIAGKGGGYIPALDSGDYRNEMPLENIMAIIETIKEYR